MGKGGSLDRWIVDPRPVSGALFACNEVPYAGLTEWCYWVTGERVFKGHPTPPRCVPIRRWPGPDDGGYIWTPGGFLTDAAQRSVGAVAIWVLGEWLKRHGAKCDLTMVGFDAIDYRAAGDASLLGYAKCIPVERLINPTGNKPGATKPWTYGRANRAIRNALSHYAMDRWSSVEWYHRNTQES